MALACLVALPVRVVSQGSPSETKSESVAASKAGADKIETENKPRTEPEMGKGPAASALDYLFNRKPKESSTAESFRNASNALPFPAPGDWHFQS